MEDAQAMLRCLGGNSPFLSALALREAATIRWVWEHGPDDAFDLTLSQLDHVSPLAKRTDIAAALRKAKREAAVIIAIADIGGVWPLETVTGALSQLAEATLRLAIRHLMRVAHDAHEIQLPDPDRPDRNCGFVALGMGKLGARELNYSSDIDLILIYDAAARPYATGKAANNIGSFTSRLARDLVTLMEARDANGYVFRTDLRLRPDPAAMPPAVSLLSALTYYESMGQNWERTAMLKARPVAGDLSLGRHFLESIRPFVWRRGLDFAAVAEIHAMKRRINAAKKVAMDPNGHLGGFNVKLGEGGIREIEFIAQTLQVVWGGRDPSLRLQATMPALRRLTEKGHLPAATGARLIESYRFLRQVEHRLQMVNDRQTHSLPEQESDQAQIACFMGYPDLAAFLHTLRWHLRQVRASYQAVFETVPDGAGAEVELDFSGEDSEASVTEAALRDRGFGEPARIVATIRQWFAGSVRAVRSSRARELMATVLPAVLAELAKQPNPDEAFGRFDRFISALPTGVQPMSLFQHNPVLLERLAAVLGAAPLLSDHLTRNPSAIEGLLSAEDTTDPRGVIRARMADAVRLEEVIQIVRRAVKEQDFYLSVADLEGRLSIDESGLRRAALAEAALAALIPRVLADFETRFGRIVGGALAVVAMGKAGGREMMAGSDLDLMFIYDHPETSVTSVGARELPTSQWFVRAVQACIAAVTAPGVEGPMYLLDMRLRPSGNKGPLAVSLESFRRYHDRDAWTWERMALTRARVITGSAAIRRAVNRAIEAAVRHPAEADQIRADARDMRQRMLRDLPAHGPWDVKSRAGGLVEIEFIAQTLQLVHAHEPWFRRASTTRFALSHLSRHGATAGADAGTLIRAERVWRAIQGILRLTVGRVEADVLPDATAMHLLRSADAAGLAARDIADLLHQSDDMARQVRDLFKRYIGRLGA